MQLQHACSAGALELFPSFLFLVNLCKANKYLRVCVCFQTEFSLRTDCTNTRKQQTCIFGYMSVVICSKWTLTDTDVRFWAHHDDPLPWFPPFSFSAERCFRIQSPLITNLETRRHVAPLLISVFNKITLYFVSPMKHDVFLAGSQRWNSLFWKCDGWGSSGLYTATISNVNWWNRFRHKEGRIWNFTMEIFSGAPSHFKSIKDLHHISLRRVLRWWVRRDLTPGTVNEKRRIENEVEEQ